MIKNNMEPKTCFGHNRNRKDQNQRKFKGYVCSDDGYKSVSEGMLWEINPCGLWVTTTIDQNQRKLVSNSN
jgi:hypothetical protein